MKVALLARQDLFTLRGGDTVQIEMTASALKNLDFDVQIYTDQLVIPLNDIHLLHFFNIGRPEGIMAILPKLKVPLVISSIYVDYSSFEKADSSPLRKIISAIAGKHGFEYLKVIARWVKQSGPAVSFNYLKTGQYRSIQKILNRSSAIISSTHSELQRLSSEFKLSGIQAAIPLGVSTVFTERQTTVPRKNAILSVGRIEGLKNQLRLIKVCNQNKWPLTIVGTASANHSKYWDACRNEATDLVTFAGAKSPEELKELYESHQVHAMPSYFETFNLTSLEALVCGCRPVLGNNTDAVEVYRDSVFYTDPNSEASITQAIEKAMKTPVTDAERKTFRENHNWALIAKRIGEIYNEVLSAPKSR
jgi:glycosyltransferase involved in cell wall biosynthesis